LVGCAPGWVGPALKGEMHEGHDVLVVTDHVVDCRLHGVTGRLSRLHEKAERRITSLVTPLSQF